MPSSRGSSRPRDASLVSPHWQVGFLPLAPPETPSVPRGPASSHLWSQGQGSPGGKLPPQVGAGPGLCGCGLWLAWSTGQEGGWQAGEGPAEPRRSRQLLVLEEPWEMGGRADLNGRAVVGGASRCQTQPLAPGSCCLPGGGCQHVRPGVQAL